MVRWGIMSPFYYIYAVLEPSPLTLWLNCDMSYACRSAMSMTSVRLSVRLSDGLTVCNVGG